MKTTKCTAKYVGAKVARRKRQLMAALGPRTRPPAAGGSGAGATPDTPGSRGPRGLSAARAMGEGR
eukprot:13395276-Alexandrium_andersonii.AAC.1